MKRIILYFLAALLLFAPVESFARTRLLTSAPVYKGTITGLRISAVDGTAFIDNAGATIPTYADGNHQIEIYDASNRMLRGVLKAAGTSEGLDSNIFAGFDFTNWGTEANSAIADADTYSSSAAAAGIRQAGVFTSYTLYKSSVTGSTTSGSVTLVDVAFASNIYATMGDGDKYWTNNGLSVIAKLRNGAIATTDISTLVSQKVIAPSSSGATIVSAKAGETYNFSYKNPSFTYNASQYYCIIKTIR